MNKILIIAPSWVGDAVMAQSLFKIIRRDNKDARISVLAAEFLQPLFARMPEVAEVLDMPLGHGVWGFSARRRLGHKLRAYGFAQAIILPNSLKSALIPFFTKIPRRTGFVGEQRYGLLNDWRRLGGMRLQVQRFVALGMAKGAAVVGLDGIPRPRLAVAESQVAAALAKHNLDCNAPITALCPGAEYGPAKRWPPRHFAAVARHQLQKGGQVWLFGAQNDRAAAETINQLCDGRCNDLTALTTLGEAVDLLSRAAVVVTNDSGLMHIAGAVGARVIAIYGSSSDAFTPPLAADATRLSLGLDCSPCFKRECPLGHTNCLINMQPEKIIAEL